MLHHHRTQTNCYIHNKKLPQYLAISPEDAEVTIAGTLGPCIATHAGRDTPTWRSRRPLIPPPFSDTEDAIIGYPDLCVDLYV